MLFTTIFEPIKNSDNTLAIICTVIAIASIIALVYFNRKPKKPEAKIINGQANYNDYQPDRFGPLRSMGFFFIFLICISTAFFSWWATIKITPVTITDQYIETNFGKAEWSDIQRIYVHEDQKIAPFSGKEVGEITKILTIIEISGKTHALSEKNFDINAMGKEINLKMKEESKSK